VKISASTPLTKAFLKHIKIFEAFLPYHQWVTFEALLIGRLLLQAPSSRKIFRQIMVGCSIATWYRYIKCLAETPFDFGDFIHQLHGNGQLRMNRTGIFIIDGHVIPHSGTHMEGVSQAYSSCDKKPIWGLETEMVHYWCPTKQFPVDFRIFLAQTDLCITRQKAQFKTKNELVREMVSKLLDRNFGPEMYLLDAGLGVKDTLKVIIGKQQFFITRPKKNFGLTYNHHHQSVIDLFESILPTEFQPTIVKNPKTKQSHEYLTVVRDAFIPGLGTIRLVFIDATTLTPEEVQDTAPSQELVGTSQRKFRVFMSNKLTLSAGDLLNTYAVRWTIETAFRDQSQNMGFHECRFCEIAFQRLFLLITCLSYIFLIWAKSHPFLMNYGDVTTTLGEVRRAFMHYCQNEFIELFKSIEQQTSCPEELACVKSFIYS
jgi:hypothetical protein